MAAVAIVGLCAACSGGGSSGGSGVTHLPSGPSTPAPSSHPSAAPTAHATSTPQPTPTPLRVVQGLHGIEHVVVVVQENRSFDNLFHAYPGADSANGGYEHNGTYVPLAPEPLDEPFDLGHDVDAFKAADDHGKMDGFDIEPGNPSPTAAYAYAPLAQVQPYWTLAGQYVLADQMFASQIDSSFTAHQYLVAAQSGSAANVPTAGPWGCDAPPGTTVPTLLPGRKLGPGIFPCFDYLTIADELDAADIPWRYYAPWIDGGDQGGSLWDAFDADQRTRYGPDWPSDVVYPETKVLTDVPAGNFATVTWVIPDWLNSDHPFNNSATGPEWVASVVNAVEASSDWDHTVVFVVWDDWGGWYDHVPPQHLDLHGLGFRVPLLVISPYAKRGYVSHVQYEFGSILKFIETTFGLNALAASDARANPLDDCFDFAQAPRRPIFVRTRRSAHDFATEVPSGRPPDND